MASGPITSWQIDEETVTDFIFLGSSITVDGDCSHEIKRCLLLRRKAMIDLNSILKRRILTSQTKVYIAKTIFSSNHVWMWELDHKDGWVPKNWCFWTVVLDCKEIKPVTLKEMNSEYSLERLMLKLQYFGNLMEDPTHWKRAWCW